MCIREFQKEDFPAIERIYGNAKLDELSNETEAFKLLPLKEDSKRYHSLMESKILVYEKDEIHGYSAYTGQEIRALFVDPKYRGTGVGKALLQYMLSQIEGDIRLYVAHTNVVAKSLYHRFGFCVSRKFETTYNGKPVMANEMVALAKTQPKADKKNLCKK